MGRYTGSSCRLCRTENKKLFLKGLRCKTEKCAIAKKKGHPGKGAKGRIKKLSDYGIQLREKQKLKRIYGMLEKQFKIFFNKAEKIKGITGDNLFILLERRLDNIIFRMRFANSRNQARQLVVHGHITVNGRIVNVPSFLVRENDVIEVKEKSKRITEIKESLKEYSRSGVMPWIEVDPDKMTGKLKNLPRRNDITDLAEIKEQLIVELYSK